MRIERDFSNIASETVRRRQVEPAQPKAPTEAKGDLANTADLVSLSVNLQSLPVRDAAGVHKVSLDALKTAYEAGAIKPDPGRLAAALLRWSNEPGIEGLR